MTDSPTPQTTAPEPTGIDLLTAVLNEAVPQPSIVIVCKHRPGWAARHRIDIASSEIADWRSVAAEQDPGAASGLLNRLIIANTCQGFLNEDANGKWTDVLDEKGRPVTYGAIATRSGAVSVADAVKTWLVTDGAVVGTADAIYIEAGFARVADTIADPTRS